MRPRPVNGPRRLDESVGFFGAKILPAQHLMKRTEAAEIARHGVRDLTVKKMDLTPPIVLGSQVKD